MVDLVTTIALYKGQFGMWFTIVWLIVYSLPYVENATSQTRIKWWEWYPKEDVDVKIEAADRWQ